MGNLIDMSERMLKLIEEFPEYKEHADSLMENLVLFNYKYQLLSEEINALEDRTKEDVVPFHIIGRIKNLKREMCDLKKDNLEILFREIIKICQDDPIKISQFSRALGKFIF